jgi:hypothetical protein
VGGAGGLSPVASGWGQSQDLRESEASSLACPCAVRLSRLAGSTRALKLKRKPEPESLALFWRTAKLQHDGRMVVSRLAAPKAVRKLPDWLQHGTACWLRSQGDTNCTAASMHWEKEGAIIDSICADYGRTLLGWTGWTGWTLTGLGSLQPLEMETDCSRVPFLTS